MKIDKFANLANKENETSGKTDHICERSESRIRESVLTLINALKIKNGSFKIYVHNGKPGERVEIQSKIITEI